MNLIRLFISMGLSIMIVSAFAQNFSNKGKEFWLVFPPHQANVNNFATLSIYLTSDKNSSGIISYNGNSQTFIVTANQTTEIILNRVASYISGAESANTNTPVEQVRIVSGKGIKVTVDDGQPAVVAYAHMFAGARSSASLILPTSVLGKTYYAISWNQTNTSFQSGEFARSQFSVIATENNTSIRINLKRNGLAVASPIFIDLPKAGDIYQFQDIQDLSGTFIESIGTGANGCKKIAVFSGSTSLGISTTLNTAGCTGGSSIDPLYQQCYPTNSWGKMYGVTPFRGKNKLNYRVIASEDNTTVLTNGSSPIILNKGEFNTVFADMTGANNLKPPFIIESDKPIAVAQFSLTQSCDMGVGDPDMIFLNPVEQSISDITVFLSSKQAITDQNINIFIKNAGTAISSFKINGVSEPISSFIAIGNTGYSYLQKQFIVGASSSSSIQLTSDSGFNAICYGFGSYESYGYSAGTNIIDLNPPLTIQNEFSASNVSYSATCSNAPFKINLALTYQPTSITVNFSSVPSAGVQSFTYSAADMVPLKVDSSYIFNGKLYYLFRIPQLYQFSATGSYPVKITTISSTTLSDGCSNNNTQEITDNIIVNDPPIADFKIESNGCINQAIALTDLSDGIGRPIVRWQWEFSDGTTSSVQSPTKLFTTANNYTAKLTSITDFGCINQVTKPINISAKPIAGFSVPATRCLNNDIVFTDASSIEPGSNSNTISQWRWNLDNGAGVIAATSNANQSFNYTSWGNKNVYLVTESNTGCVSDTFRIAEFKINPLPEVGFIIPEVCLDDAFAPFIDTSNIDDGSKAAFMYSWKFDDGISTVSSDKRPVPLTETIANPNPSYKTFGDYTVSLKITSNAGCTDSLAKPFKVNGSSPIPKFEVQNIVNATPLCSNDSIRIVNQSTVNFGAVTRIDIYWDSVNYSTMHLQDDSPIKNKIYSYRYPLFPSASTPTSNSMKISMVAFSGQSPTCIRSIHQVIDLLNSPKATFTDIRDICYDAAPRQINQGSFVSAMAATQIYSGKGIDATGLFNPATMGVGSEQIKYLVQNSSGCKDSAIQPITVWPSPTANWNMQSVVCEKNDLQFTDLSVPNYSNITSRNWIFGDGTTQTNTTANAFTKKYISAQNYTASLQVITDSGCKSNINQQVIKVNPLPIVNFTLPSICLPDGRGTFNNQSSIVDGTEALFSYQWNFGDAHDLTSSTLKNPTHKFIALGPYDIQLKVSSKEGCVDSLTRSLTTIYPWPKAAFSATPTEICLGDHIQFNDLGNGISSNAVTWNWNLANGNTSTLQNPSKRFTDSGTFDIQFYFFNEQGCVSDTLTKQIMVHPYPKLTLGPKINVLEGGSSPLKPQYKYGTNLSYLWTPSTYLNNDTDSIPITSPLDDITYQLVLTGIGGCSVTDQIDIKVLLSPVVPNAFSPNGDGINDKWRILYLESYPGATVDVYDRYGQVVFSSVGYSVDWDGTVKGKDLPIGTYYYIINPKNGRKIVNGSVTIIR